MGLTITYVLSLFSLLAISSGIFFLSKRARLPYTVLLVAVGTFVLVPLSHIPLFSFIDDFSFTPELLFYIFLPILIFESAYNMNIRRVVENIRTISVLAVISLIISAVFIGGALYGIFGFFGLHIPFIVTLLFGALISATDPVAVLALFKDFGAPRRLSLIFEGESIFNDGTAVALFFVILAAATELSLGQTIGASDIFGGFITFFEMVIGGILMGLIIGGSFAKIIGYTRHNEFVSITLTIVLAHLTFITTELISAHVNLFGHAIHFSAIISTTIASMVMGNYGRAKIPPHAEEFVEKFWGQFAFLTNSLVFILIGLMFSSLPFKAVDFVLPVVITIVVVAIGRALSIYPVVGFLNATKKEELIPRSWQHLLAWGSLRGALAITMVMLIPPTLTVPGWSYDFSIQEFLLALTIGCIFATLFVKAPTIGWLMDHLKISNMTAIEKLEYGEALALVYLKALTRLQDFLDKGYIDQASYEKLIAEYRKKFNHSLASCKDCVRNDSTGLLADRVLRLYAIGIERHYLKELYEYSEVNEKIYKQILGKLAIQHESVDRGEMEVDPSRYQDSKDVFEVLARMVRKVFAPASLQKTPADRYRYYRAQSIISRKVLKEFIELEKLNEHAIFDTDAFARTKKLYEIFRKNSTSKMESIVAEHPETIERLSTRLAHRGIAKVEETTLDDLFEKEMVTPKVYIAIRDEFEKETNTAY